MPEKKREGHSSYTRLSLCTVFCWDLPDSKQSGKASMMNHSKSWVWIYFFAWKESIEKVFRFIKDFFYLLPKWVALHLFFFRCSSWDNTLRVRVQPKTELGFIEHKIIRGEAKCSVYFLPHLYTVYFGVFFTHSTKLTHFPGGYYGYKMVVYLIYFRWSLQFFLEKVVNPAASWE